MPLTWGQLLAEAGAALPQGNEARWMVEQVSGLDLAGLPGALEEPAPARAVASCRAMVRRREAGEPLQYVLGRWAFRRLELLVDRRVLIPRPETEQVVEIARQELGAMANRGQARVAVDLGTGSGAIALSLAAEEPGLTVWATDASAQALAVARANLAGLGGWAAPRVRLVQGDWYEALPAGVRGQVELVVANPPYVSEAEVAGLPDEVVAWEPRDALVSGPTGMEAVETVVSEAPGWLNPPGSLVVELAPHQATQALELAARAGFDEASVRADLAGRPRALVARLGWRGGPGSAAGAGSAAAIGPPPLDEEVDR
jgi:release factor glutamine methyltransferase